MKCKFQRHRNHAKKTVARESPSAILAFQVVSLNLPRCGYVDCDHLLASDNGLHPQDVRLITRGVVFIPAKTEDVLIQGLPVFAPLYLHNSNPIPEVFWT